MAGIAREGGPTPSDRRRPQSDQNAEARGVRGRHPELERVLVPEIESMGYECIWLEFKSGILRVYIDHPDGVGLADCEQVSDQLSGVLDVEDPIAGEYRLEISSPGFDRPLGRLNDFERFTGRRAKLVLRVSHQGQRRFTGVILGTDPTTEQITLRVDESDIHIPFDSIDTARLDPRP